MGGSANGGLNAEELALLRMSVGYGRQQSRRPLSPVEVGEHLARLRRSGDSRGECGRIVGIDSSGVGRFLKLLELPTDVQSLVDWGSRTDFLSFSAAVELGRVNDSESQRALTSAILKEGLSSKEVSQVVQLITRSGAEVRDAVEEILGMRPIVVRRFLFIGSVGESGLATQLGHLRQAERDALLGKSLEHLGLSGASGRLGTRAFTLVGGEEFGESLTRLGSDRVEVLLRDHLQESVDDAPGRS